MKIQVNQIRTFVVWIVINQSNIKGGEKMQVVSVTNGSFCLVKVSVLDVVPNCYPLNLMEKCQIFQIMKHVKFSANKIHFQKKVNLWKKVLYYIGDRKLAQHKWRQKWTGPWRIDQRLNDSTIIIGDESTGNQKRVSIDRIKEYKQDEYTPYSALFKDNMTYLAYKDKLAELLAKHSGKIREQGFNLDYNAS